MGKILSVFGVMYVTVNSQKDKVKALKKHILKDIVPRGFDARIKEIQEKRNQQTTQLQQAFKDRDNQIQAIHYENVVWKHKEMYIRPRITIIVISSFHIKTLTQLEKSLMILN